MRSGRTAAAAPAVAGADPWPGPTIAHMLERLDRQAGSTPAIVFRGRRVTFSELREEASRLAAHLIRLGVGPGDRVAILMPPSDAWAAVHYGVISSGALLVPINVAFKARELSFVLRQSGARCVVVAERFRDVDLARRIEEVVPEIASATPGEPLASAEYPSLEWAILHADRPRPGAWLSLGPLLRTDPGDAAARRLEIQRSELGPKSSCAIVYTSGSTGFPKPALLHHTGLLAGAWGYGTSVDLQDDDTVLVPWPTFHVSGMNAGMTMAHIRGRPAWLMEAYDPGHALDTIEQERISVFLGFDTTFTTLLSHPAFRPERVRSITRLLLATGPALYDRAFRAFPSLRIASKCYAMTETCGPSALVLPDMRDPTARKYGHGTPVPGMELRIVNPADDSPVVPGERGEIRVRGVNLFNGYHGMEEETARVFDRDGWFKTGDLGRIDERGMLFFEGRYKRMVKSGGENVSEREVECYLEDRIPGVNIAQVVGVPDPVWGEAVIAFLEPLVGASLGEADVRRRCKEEIADFKVPKRVFVVSDREWPRNEVGKISKNALVAMALERLGQSPAN